MATVANKIYNLALFTAGLSPSSLWRSPLFVYQGVGSRLYGISFRYNGGGKSVQAEVEWRWRRRMTPAAAFAEDPYGGDVWVAWDGADLSDGTYAVAEDEDGWGPWQTYLSGGYTPTVYDSSGVFCVGTSGSQKTLAVPYDLSSYDYAQLQMRARLYGPGGSVSEWTVVQYEIVFRPTVATSGWLNEDGTATLQGVTDWTRDKNLLSLQFGRFPDVPDDWEVTVPAEEIRDTGEDGLRLHIVGTFTTGDGAVTSMTRFVELTEPTPAAPVPEPSITVDTSGIVAVRPASSYSSVAGWATYSDEEGNAYQEKLTFVHGLDAFAARMQTPPMGVGVEVAIVATAGDNWQRFTQTVTVPDDGAIHFDWPATDSHFELRYNLLRQYGVDMQADAVSVAGRALPVSRHGGGRTSRMTISGTLLNPAKLPGVGDTWLDALAALSEPHDWIIRAPGGMRRRVCIESYAPEFDVATADRLAAVTITASEVADDGLV